MSETETTAAIQPATPAKLGRPTIYTDALADRIFKTIASGRTLREVCREEWAPDHDTLYEWRKRLPGFADALAHARRSCADHLAEACIELADGVDPDSDFGAARVSKAREQVGVRRWLAGCLDRETYGDRPAVQVNIGSVAVAFARLTSPAAADDD